MGQEIFERFTERLRKVLSLADREAQHFKHEYIGTEHLLLAMIKVDPSVGIQVLRNLGVDLQKVRMEVEKLMKPGPDAVSMGKLPLTPRAKKVFEIAAAEAQRFNHNHVGTEHLLMGLLLEQEGVAAQVLMNLGLGFDAARKEVRAILGAGQADEGPVTASPEPSAEARLAEARRLKDSILAILDADMAELPVIEFFHKRIKLTPQITACVLSSAFFSGGEVDSDLFLCLMMELAKSKKAPPAPQQTPGGGATESA